jgi:signal transduction histidine kinase
LPQGALLDHLPAILDRLAVWCDGGEEGAEAALTDLAGGHALQRLGFGLDLVVIGLEYAELRRILLARLLQQDGFAGRELVRLNEGIDRVVQFAIRRYSDQRELLRDRFIGILGHDLRTPLEAATLAASALLRSEALESKDRKRVLIVARSTERMTRLVGAVLDFARGHLGDGIPSNPQNGDMEEICASAVADAEAAYPERSITLDASGDLRGAFDRDRALQALGNLIRNAVHYGEDPICVRAWQAERNDAVFTSVSNRGAPISDETKARLFDPFAHASRSHRGGLGLGLYIVSQIVAAHGGTCEVTSNRDETTFTLRWPRAVPSTGDQTLRRDR